MSNHRSCRVDQDRVYTAFICDDPTCQFYGQETVQGVCHTTEGELASFASLEQCENVAKGIIDSYRSSVEEGGTEAYIAILENLFISTWMNFTGTLDECVRLRRDITLPPLN